MTRKRGTQVEREQRFGIIIEYIANGVPDYRIKSYLEEKTGLSRRQVERDLAEAKALISGLSHNASEYQQGLLLKRIESLLYAANQDKDNTLVLQTLKLLYEVQKTNFPKGGKLDEPPIAVTGVSPGLEAAIQALGRDWTTE